MRKKIIYTIIPLLLGTMGSAHATEWVTTITQGGVSGTVTFDDWGYVGPNGRTANDFSSVNGFNGAAQIQRVVTTGPDGLTPDAPQLIREDLNNSTFYWDANMDSQVNFYDWGYTTVAGSTFSNMQIDADGDYLIARNDMAFNWYGQFDYQYAGDPSIDQTTLFRGTDDGVYDTNIGFQPYALSDATGWCGSITASNPAALEAMAGQVTFDFGFEAFLPTTGTGSNGVWDPGEGSMQIVSGFEMRSYGTLSIDFNGQVFTADAVVNNTNPLADTTNAVTGEKEVGGGGVDEEFYNKVSFMGGGVVPAGAYVLLADATLQANGKPLISNDNILAVLDVDSEGNPIVPEGMSGTVYYQQNSFAGYAFLLRADGIRIIEAVDYSLYTDLSNVPFVDAVTGEIFNYDENGNVVYVTDLSAVPVPAAVWLFGSGLIALAGIARRKKS